MMGRRVCLRSWRFCGTVEDRQERGEALTLKTPTPPQRGAWLGDRLILAISICLFHPPKSSGFRSFRAAGTLCLPPSPNRVFSYATGEPCPNFDQLGKSPAVHRSRPDSTLPSAFGKIFSTSWTRREPSKPKRRSGNATPERPPTRPPQPGNAETQPSSLFSTVPLIGTNVPGSSSFVNGWTRKPKRRGCMAAV